MSEYNTVAASRFIGLDIHKAYFVAAGVNSRKELVFGPQRVSNAQLERWMRKHLTSQDAVVLEMTTNTYAFYDTLLRQVHSVTVVHPPHVALITRAPVKTDRKAAVKLAQLHAAGRLVGIWVPPQAVRDLRALIAQRAKMVRLQTQGKNRLHALLHRHHCLPLEQGDPFAPDQRDWWLGLSVSDLEQYIRVVSRAKKPGLRSDSCGKTARCDRPPGSRPANGPTPLRCVAGASVYVLRRDSKPSR